MADTGDNDDAGSTHAEEPNDSDSAFMDLQDWDSALGFSDRGSAMWEQSVTKSIRSYRLVHGRTYHAYKAGLYNAPNDAQEIDRLDMQHHLFFLSLNSRLHLAPLPKEIGNCLDVGTGTGLWAIDFAEEHPEAKVIGVDLSPIQPSWVPPNVEFFVDDVEEPWTFHQMFDFVHLRAMVGSFADWPGLFKRAFDGMSPGGWIECQELGDLCDFDNGADFNSTPFKQWWTAITAAFAQAGKPLNAAPEIRNDLMNVGFEDVHEKVLRWPIGSWPTDKQEKEMGLWGRENMMEALEGWALLPLTKYAGWTVDEVQELVEKVRQDLAKGETRYYLNIHVVYARKPVNSS